MRMGGLFDGIFWGVVLIVLGAWFLVRRHVPVHIPVIRIIIAVLFVYVGIRVLVRGPDLGDRNTVVFSGRSRLEYAADRGRDYNIIFGSGDVDLSGAAVSEESVSAEVNVIFGSGTLRINSQAPVRVDMSSVFGTVTSPDERSVAFGERVYTTASYSEGAPALRIKAVAVFGSLKILP